MSEHQNDREDMLESLGRIAEEQGMHEEDDDSFDAEAGLTGGESLNRGESMGTEGSSSVFVMGNQEEYDYPRGESFDLDDSQRMAYPRRGSHNSQRSSFDDSQSTEDRGGMAYARRGSHNSRRSSFMSTDSSGNDSPRASPSDETQRSSSSKRRPRRRKSINLTSFRGSSFSDGAPPKVPVKSFRPLSRLSKLGPSTRRTEVELAGGESVQRSAFISVGQMGSTQLEDAAAAAAVVALSAGAAVGSKRQYVVDDAVLVFLNILNHTNSVDPQEAFTVMPVNKYGFPSGEGHRPAEQQGPYVYVMATVIRVHFDEDVPYYTVVRADTGAEQRADVGKSLLYLSRAVSRRSFLDSSFTLSCPSY